VHAIGPSIGSYRFSVLWFWFWFNWGHAELFINVAFKKSMEMPKSLITFNHQKNAFNRIGPSPPKHLSGNAANARTNSNP
jgi:hypothetical protein